MKNLLSRFLIILTMTYIIPGIVFVFFGENKVEKVIDDQPIVASILDGYVNIAPDLANDIDIPAGITTDDYCNYDILSDEIDDSIEITLVSDGVIVLGLDTYIMGVIAQEMSPSWPCEALKAQAVAARTYVLKQIDKSGYRLNSTMHQVYK